jgi:hypothetical protein
MVNPALVVLLVLQALTTTQLSWPGTLGCLHHHSQPGEAFRQHELSCTTYGHYSECRTNYMDTSAVTPCMACRSGHLFGGLGLASAAAGLTFDSMQQELLAVSATEVVVHMARTAAAASRRPQRAAHASARRLARTLVCLMSWSASSVLVMAELAAPSLALHCRASSSSQTCMSQTQAPAFGAHVLKLVAGLVESSSGDVSALAFWWSNAAHLRGLLQGGALTGITPPGLADPLMPQVGVLIMGFAASQLHLCMAAL